MRKKRRAYAIIDSEINDIASLNGGLMAIYWFKTVAESEIKKLESKYFKSGTLSVKRINVESLKR